MVAEIIISNNINLNGEINWVISEVVIAATIQQIKGTIKLAIYSFVLSDNSWHDFHIETTQYKLFPNISEISKVFNPQKALMAVSGTIINESLICSWNHHLAWLLNIIIFFCGMPKIIKGNMIQKAWNTTAAFSHFSVKNNKNIFSLLIKQKVNNGNKHSTEK